MSATAVVYYSKYGSTERYAQYIAKELGADILEAKKCSPKKLSQYDNIVYGGGIYCGGIKGIDLITKNLAKFFSEKRIYVFAVGIGVESEANRKQCLEINFGNTPQVVVGSDHLEEGSYLGQFIGNIKSLLSDEPLDIPCYFFPGAYHGERLKTMDKAMMKVVRKMMGEQSQDSDLKKMIDGIDQGCDWVDLTLADALIEQVKMEESAEV